MSQVQVSTLLDATETPSAATDVWVPSDLLRGEWSAPIELSHSWQTTVGVAGDAGEQRRAALGRPRRVATHPLLAMTRQDLAALRNLLVRTAQSAMLAPLITEQSALLAPAQADDTTIVCPTTERLIFSGQLLAVGARSPGALASEEWRRVAVASVGDGEITLTAPVGIDLAVGARIVPLMEAEPIGALSGQGAALFARSAMDCRSSPARGAASALPATTAPGVLPGGAQVIDGLPVFDVWPDQGRQQRIGALRRGTGGALGLGAEPTFAGPRASQTATLSFTFGDRPSARRLLRWVDAMRGRHGAFWLISPITGLELHPAVTTVSGDSIAVLPFDWLGRFNPWPQPPTAIAIVERLPGGGRHVQIARILSSNPGELNGVPGEQLGLDRSLNAVDALNVERIAFAHHARFADDSLTERWFTTHHMQAQMRFVELLNETAIDIGVAAPCPDPPDGVVYDCTPILATEEPPPGTYREAEASTACNKDGQPRLFILASAVDDWLASIGALNYAWFVVKIKGVHYGYRVGTPDAGFAEVSEASIGALDFWILGNDAMHAFDGDKRFIESFFCESLACVDEDNPITVLGNDEAFSERDDCVAAGGDCPDTVIFCSNVPGALFSAGCPGTTNCEDNPPALADGDFFCFECVFKRVPFDNVTECGDPD